MSVKRSFVVATAALLVIVVGPIALASPALAAPVNGGVLKNHHPVNGVMGTPDGVSYTFKAVAGRHVTLAATNVSVIPESSGLTLSAYDSHGDADVPGIQIFTGQNHEIDFTPTAAQAGPTTVVIGPWNAGATGSFTLTMARDLTGTLASGTAVRPNLRFGGQHADYTFTAVAGQHVTVAAFNGNFVPQFQGMTLDVFGADGVRVAPGVQFYTGQTHSIDYTPTAAQAGLTHVVITPYNYETTGKFTLAYAADSERRLTLAKPVAGNLKFAGQHVLYSFRIKAGQPADILITNTFIHPNDAAALAMGVYDANGGLINGTYYLKNGSDTQVYFVPTAEQAGIGSVGISPYTAGSTGTFTITYTNSFH
jgi:hypothetical protein